MISGKSLAVTVINNVAGPFRAERAKESMTLIRIVAWDSPHWHTCKGVPKTQQLNFIQAAVRSNAMEIRPTVGLAISRKPPKVAQYLARNPDSASQPNAVADMSLSALGHDTQLVDFVTAFPQHRRHKLSTTKNGAAAEFAAKAKNTKYRKGFDLSTPGVHFVAFAAELPYGTVGQPGQELTEWKGHLGFPFQEVEGKFVDVDGQYGAYISRAYARIAVAVEKGNAERLLRWLQPLQTEPVLRVAAAPVINVEEVDEDEEEGWRLADEDWDDEEVLDEGIVDMMEAG